MRDDKERLKDILDSIQIIERSTPKNVPLHQLNEIELLGIVKCIEILGEACRCVSEDLKKQHKNVPWREIANMRNILAHQYFEIDEEKIEKVINENLSKLKEQIKEILDTL